MIRTHTDCCLSFVPRPLFRVVVASVAACILSLPITEQVVQAQPVTVVSRTTVFEYHTGDPYDRNNLYGFNHAPSVALMPDGRLLAAWFSGPYEAAVNQVILGCFSGDGGGTWSGVKVLQDDPVRSDFDPAFILAGDAVYMCYSKGRWNKYPSYRPGPGEVAATGPESFTIECRRSDDSGRTWSDPIRMHDTTGWGCRSNGIQLATGELILPTHDFLNWQSASLKSSDGGKTWTRSEPVKPEKGGAAEPCIAQCKSGSLIMATRCRDGVMRFSRSTDRGESWSTPEASEVVAGDSSPSIISLSNGDLVLTYTASVPPLRTSLGVRVSKDEGYTWSDVVEIASVEPPKKDDEYWSHSACYPSAVELADGNVLVVWTEISMKPSWQGGRIESAVLSVSGD